MSLKLNHASIMEAFATFGAGLSFEREFDEESAVLGTMHTVVFGTVEPRRELSIYVTKPSVVMIVEDGSHTHRAVYNLDPDCLASVQTLVDFLKQNPEMITALKGGEVIDTPIDWRGYK